MFMFSTLSPYRDSRPRSDRPVRGQVERTSTSRSKLVGYSTTRFMILVVLGLVSFACAAPLQPEPTAPTPTTAPSLAAVSNSSSIYLYRSYIVKLHFFPKFTLTPSSSSSLSSLSSSSSSSSPSTATAFAPTFFPRTNSETSTNSKSESKTFTVRFKDTTTGNDNKYIQQPIQQLLAHVNIKVDKFIGYPTTKDEPEADYDFDLVDSSGVVKYWGEIWDEDHAIQKDDGDKPGYHYDPVGLGGRLSVEREVKGKVEFIEVFEFRESTITVNKLQAESASGKLKAVL
ncbi:hypothetical protein DFH05DRAFT_1505395 [Lentinula detonsa]|uniref:Uncharacterized protein n=1 Tax=Lentinula detonsa TaxID=2804962 RepID=A0A9W8NUR1_9AGAR|nr:hypothetical protein DFH05DRAFT_1505395 [Lentinula detonsa]